MTTTNGTPTILLYSEQDTNARVSDYNFILQDGNCVAAGPEPVPAGACEGSKTTFKGSSGYRKIPGNTCTGGLQKDELVEKDCSKGKSCSL